MLHTVGSTHDWFRGLFSIGLRFFVRLVSSFCRVGSAFS